MPGCRFTRRNPCQGPRFVHPFIAFVESSPTEEKTKEPESDVFWDQLIDMIDEGILEFSRQISLKESEAETKKPKCANRCGIQRNSIDPVNTFLRSKDGKFTVSLPLGKDAKAEDLSVDVKGRDLVIQIKSIRTSPDGTSRLEQVFTKKVALPEEVNVAEVKSRLTPEGVLQIEAPLPTPEEIAKLRDIEIPVVIEKLGNGPASHENPEVDIEFPIEANA